MFFHHTFTTGRYRNFCTVKTASGSQKSSHLPYLRLSVLHDLFCQSVPFWINSCLDTNFRRPNTLPDRDFRQKTSLPWNPPDIWPSQRPANFHFKLHIPGPSMGGIGWNWLFECSRLVHLQLLACHCIDHLTIHATSSH